MPHGTCAVEAYAPLLSRVSKSQNNFGMRVSCVQRTVIRKHSPGAKRESIRVGSPGNLGEQTDVKEVRKPAKPSSGKSRQCTTRKRKDTVSVYSNCYRGSCMLRSWVYIDTNSNRGAAAQHGNEVVPIFACHSELHWGRGWAFDATRGGV